MQLGDETNIVFCDCDIQFQVNTTLKAVLRHLPRCCSNLSAFLVLIRGAFPVLIGKTSRYMCESVVVPIKDSRIVYLVEYCD